MCSYAHAFANSALSDADAAAIVVTTLCDQMRRISELIAQNTTCPVFLMNVPHTWESINARSLYASEIHRMGRFLVRLGGESPSREMLAGVMLDYDAKRSAIIESRGRMTARMHSQSLADFHGSGGVVPEQPDCGFQPSGIPIGLVGGPLLAEQFEIFNMIEAAGGHIAMDGTETGERTLPGRFDRRLVQHDPFSALADAYFTVIPDAARRPNTRLYAWLKQRMDKRKLKGIILIRPVWCDNWHAESQRIKEWLNVPLFDLNITEDSSDMNRKLTRLGAFMEMLT
jgi:benzoyl-CoA reductase/2-hydroxyglutaryl-CoA dehydratase subunit BcrC/BadD/HgdB